MRSLGSGCLSQITTIFLDLDNTLIPTRKADAKACNKVALRRSELNFHVNFPSRLWGNQEVIWEEFFHSLGQCQGN
uniref:Uncharacterized protein n=1 Tax=Phlebotomus papatasi TaxID=29031 RepID=A0A1B0D4R5_PHLPP